MDIARPDIARAKRLRRTVYGTGLTVVVILITVGVSRLEPAAPRVDLDTVFMGTVQRGLMLRNVRGTGKLVPATADDGSTIQIKEGFLSDKNGNRVQGFAPDAVTGIFPTTGTLTDLRVDQFAFTQSFQVTTTADLDLNLPAGDVNGVKQIELVVLGGTVEVGDIFSVTVNSITVSHTVGGGDTSLDAVRNALVTALNANATISAAVTAAANPISGALNLTGKVAGGTFTASASTTNVTAGVTDNAVTLTNVQVASTSGTQTFGIDVFDSNGKLQPATLNFTKSATNTWDLSATTEERRLQEEDES